jgi:hypothetical protein
MQELLPNRCDGFQSGLVAYFDILGFSQVVANENIAEMASLISAITHSPVPRLRQAGKCWPLPLNTSFEIIPLFEFEQFW